MYEYPPCPVCTPPLAVLSAAEALRTAFPDYEVTTAWRGGGWQPAGWRFVLTRRRGEGNPVCLISPDPGEIYDALSAGTLTTRDA